MSEEYEHKEPVADGRLRVSIRLRSDDDWTDAPWERMVSERTSLAPVDEEHYGYMIGLHVGYVAAAMAEGGWWKDAKAIALGMAMGLEVAAEGIRDTHKQEADV